MATYAGPKFIAASVGKALAWPLLQYCRQIMRRATSCGSNQQTMALLAVVTLFIHLLSLSAACGETWICSTKSVRGNRAAIKIVVADGAVIQNDASYYQILANNEVGIVAAYAFSPLDFGSPDQPVVSGGMILFEKRSGAFRRIDASTSLDDMPPAHGHCYQD